MKPFFKPIKIKLSFSLRRIKIKFRKNKTKGQRKYLMRILVKGISSPCAGSVFGTGKVLAIVSCRSGLY